MSMVGEMHSDKIPYWCILLKRWYDTQLFAGPVTLIEDKLGEIEAECSLCAVTKVDRCK